MSKNKLKNMCKAHIRGEFIVKSIDAIDDGEVEVTLQIEDLEGNPIFHTSEKVMRESSAHIAAQHIAVGDTVVVHFTCLFDERRGKLFFQHFVRGTIEHDTIERA